MVYVSVGSGEGVWRALSDGHLVAEALSRDGKPVEIPEREWSYLKLFEDGKRDVLKYEVLDRDSPFIEVKLKRDDLLRLWPEKAQREAIPVGAVEPFMLEPMTSPIPTGFVPLCVVLHWIMTSGGARSVALDDEAAWAALYFEKLFPLIYAGDIELIGLPCGQPLTERIPGHALTLVRVLPPLHDQLDAMLLNSPSHIDCSPFLDQEHWTRSLNDKLYMSGRGPAAWTHLQVKKAVSTSVAEARAHGKVRTRRLPLASRSNATVPDDQDQIKGSHLGRGRTEIPTAFRTSIQPSLG